MLLPIDETNRKAAVELLVTVARRDLSLVLGAFPEGLGTFVEIGSLPPDEQFARCSKRRTWLNTSAQNNATYNPDRIANEPSRSVLNRTLLEPRGPSVPTENAKAPRTAPPACRRRPTTPIVGRTLTVRMLTTVAAPTIRPPTRRTETPCTANPDDALAVLAPASRPAVCAPTTALAVAEDSTEAPIALASTSRKHRDTKCSNANANPLRVRVPRNMIRCPCEPD